MSFLLSKVLGFVRTVGDARYYGSSDGLSIKQSSFGIINIGGNNSA
jgi:hypothetical protein